MEIKNGLLLDLMALPRLGEETAATLWTMMMMVMVTIRKEHRKQEFP